MEVRMNLYVKSDECLKTYLKELEKMPELEPQQVVALGRMARDGDIDARRILILGHLRFVVSIAKQFTGGGLSLSDLICWGNLGLLDAVEGYDPDYTHNPNTEEDPEHPDDKKEARDPKLFTTYSKWYIEKYIKQAKKAWLGKPTKNEEREYGVVPDVYGKMAEYLRIDLNSKERRHNVKVEPYAWLNDLLLDHPISDGDADGDTYGSIVASDQPDPSDVVVDNETANDLIKIIAETLDRDEKKYIEMYFGISGKPMYEWDIAEQCNVDLLVVAKTINAAIVKLNKNRRIRELRGGISR